MNTNVQQSNKITLSSFFCCCLPKKKTPKKQKKATKETILKKLKITNNISKTLDTLPEKTKISFFYNDIRIGYSQYDNRTHQNYGSDIEYLDLERIVVNADYRNIGLGKEFFKITMQTIRKTHPTVTIVRWEVDPLDAFTSPEAAALELKNLHLFYRKVGAITDTEKNTGYINLKDAGYFDKD